MPAGPPVPHTDNGRPGSGDGPDNDASQSTAADQHAVAGERPAVAGEQAAGTVKQVEAGPQPGAAGAQPDGEQARPAGEQSGGQPDDDFEPYLPPGPNPFSSVHPQGTPYRPPAPPAAAEPAYEREERGYAGEETGHAGFAEHGYPPVSPYPPLPDEDPHGRHPGGAANEGASPYPAYRPYDLDDEAAGDAPLTDYGLPSPQAYGLAPPPPPAEPLPDLDAAEQVYRHEPYEAPGYPDDDLEDEESGPPPAERGRPAGGHRRAPGTAGQHRAGATENGLRGAGLHGGPARADAPPPRGPQPPVMPPNQTAPGRGYPPPGVVPPGPLPPGTAQPGPGVPRRAGVHDGPGVQRGPGVRSGPGAPQGPGANGADFSPLPGDGAVQERETADDLTAEALLHGKRQAARQRLAAGHLQGHRRPDPGARVSRGGAPPRADLRGSGRRSRAAITGSP